MLARAAASMDDGGESPPPAASWRVATKKAALASVASPAAMAKVGGRPSACASTPPPTVPTSEPRDTHSEKKPCRVDSAPGGAMARQYPMPVCLVAEENVVLHVSGYNTCEIITAGKGDSTRQKRPNVKPCNSWEGSTIHGEPKWPSSEQYASRSAKAVATAWKDPRRGPK